MISLNHNANLHTFKKISASAYGIYDLRSGKTLLTHHESDVLPVGSITKLLTAVVAHELMYLGKKIVVKSYMINNISTSNSSRYIFTPDLGKGYIGLDLLYPLLVQSNNYSASILAHLYGYNKFIHNMNYKTKAIGMADSYFVDPSGTSTKNVSTVKDLLRLSQYVYSVRRFMFDVSKGVNYKNIGSIPISHTIDIHKLQNINDFPRAGLVGAIKGYGANNKEVALSVWNMYYLQNGLSSEEIPILIVVLNSNDAKTDTLNLLTWAINNTAIYSSPK